MSEGPTRFGVVIPARNGASSISRSLGSLCAQRFDGVLDVVVVCNGCTDSTASSARQWVSAFRRRGWQLEVIESSPGRTTAINAGEARLSQVYAVAVVDQDALLSPAAIYALSEALVSGDKLFAAPRLAFTPAGGLVGRYYSGWRRLPYVARSPVTIGCYALSASGRTRWGAYPQGVPDDKFARMNFSAAERSLCSGATYEVLVPTTVAALLQARRRYTASNRALEDKYPVVGARARGERVAGIWQWALKPSNWSAALAVLVVHTAAKLPIGTAE